MMFILDRPLLLFVVTFLLLWGASWLGMAIRSRHRQFPEGMRSDYGVIIGATLTLLGLIIGFTFSMAVTRYDQRKTLEEEEANAIGTEFARVDFLPAESAARLQTLLRQYTDLRAQFYVAHGGAELMRINSDTASLQNQLWTTAAGAAKLQASPLSALAASGMNDVLNAQGYTQAAWWNRIPVAAWTLLFLIAVLSNVLLGYGAHARALVLSVILPLAVAVSFLLIADIDSPRGGIIRIQPKNLQALAASFKGANSYR
jgi:hypothetical protein